MNIIPKLKNSTELQQQLRVRRIYELTGRSLIINQLVERKKKKQKTTNVESLQVL